MPFHIQRIQTDLSREFFAIKVQKHLLEWGIKFRPIKPGSPHLNGKVERSWAAFLIETRKKAFLYGIIRSSQSNYTKRERQLMETDCNPKQLQFQGLRTRKVVAALGGGTITSDAGALLLRKIEAARGYLERFFRCFVDRWDPCYNEHSLKEPVSH